MPELSEKAPVRRGKPKKVIHLQRKKSLLCEDYGYNKAM